LDGISFALALSFFSLSPRNQNQRLNTHGRCTEDHVMKTVDQMFKHTQNLPTIPEVVRELIQSFSNPLTDTRAIAKKISMDQVLVARVLRAANSAHFGLSKQVASIDEAIFVMGMNAVRTLVIAGGLAGSLKAPAGLDIKSFWKRSAATSGYAEWLANKLKVRADLAVTGGLILHIGVVIIHMELPDESASIDKAVTAGGRRPQIEDSVLGFNHAEVSAELASRWKFPDDMCAAFRAYPYPLEHVETLPLSAVYHLADLVADSKLRDEDDAVLTEKLSAELLARLGCDVATLLADLPSLSQATSGLDELLA
jgi:HD-like signal output (HDOD) protein